MVDLKQIVLRVTGVSKAFGQQTVLDNVSLTLERGERVAIMGPSGSGKSTLLNCVAGIESIDTGSIHFLGDDITKMKSEQVTQIRRGAMTSIFQFFHLLPTLSAWENVEFPLLLQSASAGIRKERVAALIEEVGLAHRSHAMPSELSGGEMQRLAIARALITDPVLLLADEPTGSLDSRNSELTLKLMEQLVDKHGTALLMVTHDNYAASICQRVYHMMDGKLSNGENTGA